MNQVQVFGIFMTNTKYATLPKQRIVLFPRNLGFSHRNYRNPVYQNDTLLFFNVIEFNLILYFGFIMTPSTYIPYLILDLDLDFSIFRISCFIWIADRYYHYSSERSFNFRTTNTIHMYHI